MQCGRHRASPEQPGQRAGDSWEEQALDPKRKGEKRLALLLGVEAAYSEQGYWSSSRSCVQYGS